MDDTPSSPPRGDASPEEQLAWYKSQYEQLERELEDFQESSRELEAALEEDVEKAELSERKLREAKETLEFQVEEWKTKYKQAKTEANAAQNTLQKEITSLRDSNRTLQLQLRDIEVQNDDFERQARNTASSYEDIESKFNQAIERAVMMEEEIKIGEQERETLRIEAQRLKDELSDLKVEAEIMQEKIRKQTEREMQLPPLTTNVPPAASYDNHSPTSTSSSPLVTTPPDSKSVSTADTVSETLTPPSPPMSDASAPAKPILRTPINPPSRLRQPSSASDFSTTPKPKRYASTSRTSIPGRPSLGAPSAQKNAYRAPLTARGLPSTTSLNHIRNLTAQVQRLEKRVQSARSKLPAPVSTPPRASPRNGATGYVPSSVTVRSRKRGPGSTTSSTPSVSEETPSAGKHVSRLSTSGIGRLSFGPIPNRSPGDTSRPSSRASTSYSRPASRTDARPASRTELGRPMSRTSMTGTRTPLGHYSQSNTAEARRPRSSIGGSYHGHSQSVSNIDIDEEREMTFRHSTSSRPDLEGSAIPLPASVTRRQSGSILPTGRRPSTSVETGMKPPGRQRKLSEVGETY